MSTLTTIQHSSALVFGSFLFVHLAAPSVAVVAPKGESLELATKTMVSLLVGVPTPHATLLTCCWRFCSSDPWKGVLSEYHY